MRTMKSKILTGFVTCSLALGVAYAADKTKETGFAGKWATDAVATATKQKTKGGIMDSLIQNGVGAAGNAVPTGGRNGGFGGGGFGGNGGGFGGNGGGFGGTGGGGGFGGGGGGFGGGGGGFGGRDFAQFGGNQGRQRVQIDTSEAQIVEKGSSPDGVALTMELTVSGKGEKAKLAGKIKEITTDADFKVEEAKLIGENKFEFVTYEKKGNVKMPTTYKGELTDENTITVQRYDLSGKPKDKNPADGTPATLTLRRTK